MPFYFLPPNRVEKTKYMDSPPARGMTNEKEFTGHDSFTALTLSFRGKAKAKGKKTKGMDSLSSQGMTGLEEACQA